MQNRGQGRGIYSLYVRRQTTGETYHGDFLTHADALTYAKNIYYKASLNTDSIIEIVLEANVNTAPGEKVWRFEGNGWMSIG